MKIKNLIFLIIAVSVIFNSGCEKKSPSPEIVATYNGGTITKQELRQKLHEMMPRTREDHICPEHGPRHALCNSEEECEKYKPYHDQFETPQVYKSLINNIVLNEMAKKYARERKIDKKDDFKHVMKHLDEQITLGDLQTRIYEKEMKVSEIETQKYYDQHRQEFSGRTLTEVKEEIQQRLKPQVEEEYISGYIKGLEEKAFITKNYQLLTPPQPQENEIWEYFQKNKDKYFQPDAVEIEQIIVEISGDEKKARQKADKALQLLRSGEDWNKVVSEYSEERTPQSGRFPFNIERGLRTEVFDENVFKLTQGEISGVLKEEKSFFIIRLREKFPGRQKEIPEVTEQIKVILQKEKEKTFYEENKNSTLFTIHGEPYTLGVFLEELQELSPEDKFKYTTIEEKKELLERLIRRLVLVEAARDEVSSPQSKELSEQVKASVLRQMLHQEEVDENIEISDQEVEKFYQKNKLQYRMPARVKISHIRIDKGETKEQEKKSKDKIDGACKKLKPGWSKEGVDFASVAKEYSQDTNAEQGGAVDRWFAEGVDFMEELSMHPLHEVIFSLAQGEISEPFEFRGSWWIIKAREKKEGGFLEYEEVKDRIKHDLLDRKHTQLSHEKEKELLKKANLVIYNSAVKAILKEEKSKFKLAQKGENNSLSIK